MAFLSRAHCGRWIIVLVLLCTGISTSRAQWSDSTIFGWSQRKLTGVIISTIIPGAGQSYLGHTTKGAAFTITAFGSGLVTALSENNVIGRNERINELKALYKQSNNWELSNAIWIEMQETKHILDRDVKRRDLFLKVTIAVWAASVVDAIFFSEDLGQAAFGSAPTHPGPSVAWRSDANGGIQAVLTYRF